MTKREVRRNLTEDEVQWTIECHDNLTAVVAFARLRFGRKRAFSRKSLVGATVLSVDAVTAGTAGLATNSIATISAASPTRRRVRIMRVYPPGRSRNRAATSLNSFETTALLRKKLSARRRAGRLPSFPSEIIRSVKPRISFALASVVSIRSCSSSEVTRLRNSAQRCFV